MINTVQGMTMLLRYAVLRLDDNITVLKSVDLYSD